MGLVEAMSEEEYADFVEMFFDVMSPLDRVETFDLLREWFCVSCGKSLPDPKPGKAKSEHVCKGQPEEEEEDDEELDDGEGGGESDVD